MLAIALERTHLEEAGKHLPENLGEKASEVAVIELKR
jgi:hypothetical protein